MQTKPFAAIRIHTNHHRQAFTLIEMLVVISLIAILAALTTTGASVLLANARSTEAMNHLRGLGALSHAYAADNNGELPKCSHNGGFRNSWIKTLEPYAGSKDFLRSPADPHPYRQWSYSINDYIVPNPYGAESLNANRLNRIPSPSETLMFAIMQKQASGSDHFHFASPDSGSSPAAFAGEVEVELIDDKSPYLFVDGHAEILKWDDVRERLNAEGSRFLHPLGGEK